MKIQRKKSTKRPCSLEASPTGPYPSFPVKALSPHHGGLASPLCSYQAQGTTTFLLTPLLPMTPLLKQIIHSSLQSNELNNSFILICNNCIEHDSTAGRANQQLPSLDLSHMMDRFFDKHYQNPNKLMPPFKIRVHSKYEHVCWWFCKRVVWSKVRSRRKKPQSDTAHMRKPRQRQGSMLFRSKIWG